MSTKTGARGEFLTCAAILGLKGDWKVVHAPQDSIDVVAFSGANFLRISVKSSKITTNKGNRVSTYHFQNGHGGNKLLPSTKDIDIVAHCFIDAGRVGFYATEQVEKKSQRRATDFPNHEGFEQNTWDEALKIVQERLT